MKLGTKKLDLMLARQQLAQCIIQYYGPENLSILMPDALVFMREKKFFGRQQKIFEIFLETLQRNPPVFAGDPYLFPMPRALLTRLITFDGWIPGRFPPSPIRPNGQDADGDINEAIELVREALTAQNSKMASRGLEPE